MKIDNETDSKPQTKTCKVSKRKVNGEEANSNDKKRKKNAENGNSNHTEKDDIENAITKEEKEGDFDNFSICPDTKNKLRKMGIKYLFPIQVATFDLVYDGHDLIAQSRTGSGKTFSFALPLVERLEPSSKRGRSPRILVMVPTRELAKQVAENFESLSDNLQVISIYGGTPYEKQERELSRGMDVVVGTPGRIKDLAEKNTLKLNELKHVVLDEVDRMLDMGFADIVEEVLKFSYDLNGEKSTNPQTLLFSATTPDWVYKTAKKYMTKDYKSVDMVGKQVNRTAETVQHLAIKCNYSDRAATVGDVLQFYSGEHGRAMIFAPTKRDADELTVSSSIRQECHVLHGDIPQDKREMVLAGFREGKYKVLITTDVAARGLDIPEVDLVIQLEPPKDVDSYIHRSGRTGRAGRSGACVCFYKPRALADLRLVEQKAGIKFKRIGAPTLSDLVSAAAKDAAKSLDNVEEGVLEKFKVAATEILEEQDAVDLVARALAVISGMKNIEERSLLTSAKGCRTYYFKTNMEIRGPGYVFMSLERRLGTNIREGVREMRFTTDKKGCVFDVSSNFIHYIEERWTDGKYDSLERATELPDIIEPSKDGFDRGQGGRNFSRGGGGGGMNRNRMDRRDSKIGGSFGRKSAGFRSGGKRPYNNGNNSFSNDNRNKRRRFNN